MERMLAGMFASCVTCDSNSDESVLPSCGMLWVRTTKCGIYNAANSEVWQVEDDITYDQIQIGMIFLFFSTMEHSQTVLLFV